MTLNKTVELDGLRDGAGATLNIHFSPLDVRRIPIICNRDKGYLYLWFVDSREPWGVDVHIKFKVTGTMTLSHPDDEFITQKDKNTTLWDVKRVISLMEKVVHHHNLVRNCRVKVRGRQFTVTTHGRKKITNIPYYPFVYCLDHIQTVSPILFLSKVVADFHIEVTKASYNVRYRGVIPLPHENFPPESIPCYLCIYASEILEMCKGERELVFPIQVLEVEGIKGDVVKVEVCGGEYFPPKYSRRGGGTLKIHVSHTQTEGGISR